MLPKHTRSCKGMTMIELLISISILTLIMSGLFILTTTANNTLIAAYTADSQYYKFMLVSDNLRSLIKSSKRIYATSDNTGFIFDTGSEVHQLRVIPRSETSTLELDAESLLTVTKFDLQVNNGPRVSLTLESEEIPPISQVLYMERYNYAPE